MVSRISDSALSRILTDAVPGGHPALLKILGSLTEQVG